MAKVRLQVRSPQPRSLVLLLQQWQPVEGSSVTGACVALEIAGAGSTCAILGDATVCVLAGAG